MCTAWVIVLSKISDNNEMGLLLLGFCERYVSPINVFTNISIGRGFKRRFRGHRIWKSIHLKVTKNQLYQIDFALRDDKLKICRPKDDNLFFLLYFRKKPIRGDCMHIQKLWRYFRATYVEGCILLGFMIFEDSSNGISPCIYTTDIQTCILIRQSFYVRILCLVYFVFIKHKIKPPFNLTFVIMNIKTPFLFTAR